MGTKLSLGELEKKRHVENSTAGEMASHQPCQARQVELIALKTPKTYSGPPLVDHGPTEVPEGLGLWD